MIRNILICLAYNNMNLLKYPGLPSAHGQIFYHRQKSGKSVKNQIVCANFWSDKNWTFLPTICDEKSDCVCLLQSDENWSDIIQQWDHTYNNSNKKSVCVRQMTR